jgi:predicted nucleic-acid-binding protein
MIAVDTNVLVRLLVKDDESQTRSAKKLFQRLGRTDERAWVSSVVMCELVWVLSSCYGFSREQVTSAIKRLLTARQLTFAEPDRLHAALRAYETRRGDFADYLIREDAKAAGCDAVVTFDKALLDDDMFLAP